MIIEKFDFDAFKEVATQRAHRMVDNGLYSRFGLSRDARVDNALVGSMGELAFEYWLNSIGLDYKLDNGGYENRHSDQFDFLLGEYTLDIKVAKKTTVHRPNDKWTYGYPVEQKPESKDYVVVGWVDYAQKQVGFYGWITGKEISHYPVVTKNTYAKYAYLTPNHEFNWGALNKDFNILFGIINKPDIP